MCVVCVCVCVCVCVYVRVERGGGSWEVFVCACVCLGGGGWVIRGPEGLFGLVFHYFSGQLVLLFVKVLYVYY